MMRIRTLYPIAVIMPILAASSYSEIPERKGFFAGFGLGAGYLERSFESSGLNDSETNLYMEFMGGYAFNPNIAIGIDVSGWNYEADNTYGYSNSNDSGSSTGEGLFQVLLFSRYYPFRDSGLFLKIGGGMARYWNNRPNEDRYKDGWGAETAVGYDFFVSGNGTVTLSLGYNYGETEDLTYQAVTVSVALMMHQWKGADRLPLYVAGERTK